MILFSRQVEGNSFSQEFNQKLENLGLTKSQYILFIDTSAQKMSLFNQNGDFLESYIVSTAKKGEGQELGSYQTPLGLHRVASKIGKEAAKYTIFEGRQSTERIWHPGITLKKDYILTRILRLEGLEEGFNKGKNSEGKDVDSYRRFIYIHGTNEEELLGIPKSRGCVRMESDQLIRLFNALPKGSLVWIG